MKLSDIGIRFLQIGITTLPVGIILHNPILVFGGYALLVISSFLVLMALLNEKQ